MEAACTSVRFRQNKVIDTGTYSFDDLVDQFLSLVDLLFSIGHDKTMKVFLLVAGMSGIGAAFSFFHTAFASNSNLGARVGLHSLESVASRSNK